MVVRRVCVVERRRCTHVGFIGFGQIIIGQLFAEGGEIAGACVIQQAVGLYFGNLQAVIFEQLLKLVCISCV